MRWSPTSLDEGPEQEDKKREAGGVVPGTRH